ncbi:MAG TPA: ROK family protein [Candidatus Eisenbacteria bacterium]|nr:ROK family protein [Candidatus Eisenbacteria bacterium]
MSDFSIGVDLGGTNLRIAGVDSDGKLLEKLTLGAEVSRGRDFVITEMCKAIESLRTKYRDAGQLQGIGIGVPGFIDMAAGMVMESPNLPDWKSFPVRDEIEKRLGTTVILENDANSAAMGEKWLGAGREYPHMAMYTLGTGVGGGIVLDGRLWHGMTGMAGELGHFNVYADGHPCGCGSRGCLEQYASASAVVRMAREAIARGDSVELERLSHDPVQFTARSVYNLAVQGEAAAKCIFEHVGRALGIAIGAMVNALNLPMYVVGGGASNAWDAFAPAMFEEMKFRSSIYKLTSPDRVGHDKGTIVTRALLGSDAGLYGAARLPMLENFSQTEKGRS